MKNLLLLIFLLNNHLSFELRVFYDKITDAGVDDSSNNLLSFKVHDNYLECFGKCNQETSCLAFTFDKITQMCNLKIKLSSNVYESNKIELYVKRLPNAELFMHGNKSLKNTIVSPEPFDYYGIEEIDFNNQKFYYACDIHKNRINKLDEDFVFLNSTYFSYSPISISKIFNTLLVSSYNSDYYLRQYDFDLNEIRNYQVSTHPITDLHFSPDSLRLFAADHKNKNILIYLFINESQLILNQTIKTYQSNLLSITSFNHMLYVSDNRGHIMAFDDKEFQLIHLYSNLCEFNDKGWIWSVQFDTLGNMLYSCEYDNRAYIISRGIKKTFLEVPKIIRSLWINSKNRFLVGTATNLLIY